MLTVEQLKQGGDGVVVIAVRGSADIHCEDVLGEALRRISALRPRLVVLDLGSIDILTSVAIGVVVGFRTQVMVAGGRVVMAAVPAPVARTMRFTRVSELFPQFASVAEALGSGTPAAR